jgi:hypothetical protein
MKEDGDDEPGAPKFGGLDEEGVDKPQTVVVGWRVKLYQLETDGQWTDQGTGSVSCRNTEGGPKIVVSIEDNSQLLLESKIRSDDIYERQGESIIMWREPAHDFLSDIDYALSFQDSAGCVSLWESIIAVQRQYLTQQEYGQIPSFSNEAMIRARNDGWVMAPSGVGSSAGGGGPGAGATPALAGTIWGAWAGGQLALVARAETTATPRTL